MTIFGYLTHKNVRQLRERSENKSIRIRRINQQLASMLVLQSVKSTFASIPYSIFNCYWLKTMYYEKIFFIRWFIYSSGVIIQVFLFIFIRQIFFEING